MAFEEITLWEAVCSGKDGECGNVFSDKWGDEQFEFSWRLAELARADGWIIEDRRYGTVICPDCQKES